jgi:hypothetical protein
MMHRPSPSMLSSCLVLAALLIGCGDDDRGGPGTDAGPGPMDGGRMDAPIGMDGGRPVDGGPAEDGGKVKSDGGPRDGGRRDSGGGGSDVCPEMDLGMATGMGVVSGTTTDARNDVSTSCGGEEAPDRVYIWTAPSDGLWVFDLQGSSYDTMLGLLAGGCDGAELDCNDDTFDLISRVQATLSAGDVVGIVIDGYADDAGSFTLNINSASVEICDNMIDDDIDGYADCADYEDCDALPECHETECTDGIDNDGDGDADCFDYDCDGEPTCHEGGTVLCTDGLDNDGDFATDCDDFDCFVVCVEMGNCSDGVDNDLNGATDCADTECSCDPVCGGGGMACPSLDLGGALGSPVNMGYLPPGTCSAMITTCGDVGGGEVSFTWTAPADGTYQFDTSDSTGSGMLYEHVLEVRDATCSGAALGCDDSGAFGGISTIVLTMSAGQVVVIVIDAYDVAGAGYYTLNITTL